MLFGQDMRFPLKPLPLRMCPRKITVPSSHQVLHLLSCLKIPRLVGEVTSKVDMREHFVFAFIWFLSQDKLRSCVPTQFDGGKTPF